MDNKSGQPVQTRWFCQVILCCVCVLGPSFAMSFYTPNLSFSVTLAVCYLRPCVLACAWKACVLELSRKACKNSIGRSEQLCQRTWPGAKGLRKTRLFCTSWPGCLHLSSLSYIQECIWEALSRQSATGAYFAGWLHEGAGLSHASEFSAPVNLAHFSRCRGGFTVQQHARK